MPDDPTPPITDHVFRTALAGARKGMVGVGRVDEGMCTYFGHCNRPQDDHITLADFQQARGTT